MSLLPASARARFVLAAVVVVALATVLVALLIGRAGPATQSDRSPVPGKARNVGGMVTLRLEGAGHLLVALPRDWGITRTTRRVLFLASPRTCHTATVTAFVDRTDEPPAARAEHLLGYMASREFRGGPLWRGTTAAGHGFAVYDPGSLLGVESVRRRGQAVAMIVHGLPTHARCSAHDAAAPRWALSRLLQDLAIVPPRGIAVRGASGGAD